MGWALVATLCLFVGSTEWGWPDALTRSYRLSWILVASLVGACLALAGCVYQAVLRNPLADPYLLGVSSGASLAVFLWTIVASVPVAAGAAVGGEFGFRHLFTNASQQTAAFVGGIATLAIVFALAQRRGRLEPLKLLLVGVIVNAINGAFYLLLYHLARTQDMARAFRFLIGGLPPDVNPLQLAFVVATFASGLVILLFLAGHLNVSTLSESEAQSLGLHVHRLRWTAMIVASLVTASATAISGPIGFVGLVCPHLGRLLVGPDQRKLIPVSVALGASLLAVADGASRSMHHVPVGVITGFLGGPFFLFLLWRGQRRTEES